MAAAAIKMDELLVSWLGNDTVWEEIQNLVESYRKNNVQNTPPLETESDQKERGTGVITPFYPKVGAKSDSQSHGMSRWKSAPSTISRKWSETTTASIDDGSTVSCVRDQLKAMLEELDTETFGVNDFTRITKEICHFPSFFSGPLFSRIAGEDRERVTLEMLQHFYTTEMEPYDASERFFRLVKQPSNDYIVKEDFLPFIKELLNDHPVSLFMLVHFRTLLLRVALALNFALAFDAELTDQSTTSSCRDSSFFPTMPSFKKSMPLPSSPESFTMSISAIPERLPCARVRRSDLLDAFTQVDDEEDINKVTRYFSYEHFYVLYCRFWELDHDRDYRITREDLLKYGDHSLSHMIVDRIFDAAPRPFTQANGR